MIRVLTIYSRMYTILLEIYAVVLTAHNLSNPSINKFY